MPHIQIIDPYGMGYQITTRRESTLRAWLDEILPHVNVRGRPRIDDFDVLWPKVNVLPMWSLQTGNDPDWLCDARVLGLSREFRARNGDEGLRELERIRQELQAELEAMRP